MSFLSSSRDETTKNHICLHLYDLSVAFYRSRTWGVRKMGRKVAREVLDRIFVIVASLYSWLGGKWPLVASRRKANGVKV